jgi:hypothetical protein
MRINEKYGHETNIKEGMKEKMDIGFPQAQVLHLYIIYFFKPLASFITVSAADKSSSVPYLLNSVFRL